VKHILIVTVIVCLLLPVPCFCAKFEYYPLNIRVFSLLKQPTTESEPAFVFPIEVTMTGISKDKQWFRFKVFYDLVFLGKYEFEGWARANPLLPFETGLTPEVIEIK
jgi:hypothetical protein